MSIQFFQSWERRQFVLFSLLGHKTKTVNGDLSLVIPISFPKLHSAPLKYSYTDKTPVSRNLS